MGISEETQAKAETVLTLYDQGRSYREIKKALDIDHTTIKKILVMHGIEPQKPGGGYPNHFHLSHREIDRTILVYHKMGYSLSQSAKILGVHKSTIRDRLARAGIPLRGRGAIAGPFPEIQRQLDRRTK